MRLVAGILFTHDAPEFFVYSEHHNISPNKHCNKAYRQTEPKNILCFIPVFPIFRQLRYLTSIHKVRKSR